MTLPCTRDELRSILDDVTRMAKKYGQIGYLDQDDIVQESLLKVFRSNSVIRKPGDGWLVRVVHSAVIDAGRRAAKERPYVFIASQVSEVNDEYLYQHSVQDDRKSDVECDLMPRLTNMLQCLSKPLRQVLVLHSEGYSYSDIARLTNTNIGTVRSRLHYARRRAQKLLGDIA